MSSRLISEVPPRELLLHGAVFDAPEVACGPTGERPPSLITNCSEPVGVLTECAGEEQTFSIDQMRELDA